MFTIFSSYSENTTSGQKKLIYYIVQDFHRKGNAKRKFLGRKKYPAMSMTK